ncbi:unnamed protein product [Lepidochelys kempii]
MAAGDLAGSLQDEVTCSICLEYFTDPVTIECGQNFCQACLSQCWGELEPNFSCPQCRESALQRDLRPHGQLGNLAELVKCLRLQAGPEPEGQRVGDRHQEALKLSCEEDQTPLCLVCDRSWAHRTHTVVPMEEAAQEHREQIPTRLQHLWEETEELLGLKSDWDKERERLLRQTEVERPLVVSKCEGLHQFLAEQERLLLARLGELGEEIGRRREDNATHLGEEISRLSALITELEGKRQQPVLELLQADEKAMSPHPVPESPELEKRIRDFPRENNLQEAVTGFLDTNTAVTLKPVIMQGTAFSHGHRTKRTEGKNPLQSTYHTDYADSLCPMLSKKLRNHLINILYSKQGKIKNEISKMDTLIKNQPSTQTSLWLDFTKTRQAIYSAHFASLQKKKDTKLSKLLHATRGHSNGSLNPPSNIVNLSNYTLSPAEAAVLSRGLSFCPSTPTNMIQFGGDLESYFRRLRLKEYFQNTSEQHTNPQRSPYQHYRKRDSRWTPPESRNSRLDFYIECFRRRARAEIVEKQHHLPHNLSHAEHNAIHSLRNNSDIIIKKADKGGAVVIMNRSEYEQEAARQLSNTSFYKPLPYDATESYQKQLQHLLKKLPEKAQDQIRTDTPLEPRPGIFYLLPKIHKSGNPGNKARCQLCPHIYSGDTITGPNHIIHTIRGSFTCTSTNVTYAIMCQQGPSAMYIGQTGQSLRKRINGHKSDVKNYNIHKPVGEHFNLSGHAITDMKVAILKQKNFKSRLQRETAELEFICKLDTINLGLNRDWVWLSQYAR